VNSPAVDPRTFPTVHLRIRVTEDGKRVLEQLWQSMTGSKEGRDYRRDVSEWRPVPVVEGASKTHGTR
jgi:hypothetical protein